MLAGQISNQDEDEVEDELAALEAEVNGGVKVQQQQPLPSVPDTKLPERRVGLETPEGEEPPKLAGRREAMYA